MDADADSSSSPMMHIVVFPWLAFGHIIPLLELAERLAARGHRVSFVSTPRNISRLRPVTQDDIHFVALPLPRLVGLPEGAEATTDLTSRGTNDLLLEKAFDGLTGPFSAFLDDEASKGRKPDWIVVDCFHYLAVTAAAERGVPSAMFVVFASATTAAWGVPRVSPDVDSELGATASQRFMLTYQRCKIISQRCCVEFDPEDVPLLPGIFGKPFAPLGLLPPPLRTDHLGGDDLVAWLDRHPAKSVVYVALGTEAPLSTELAHELAMGLELAGTPFLWVLKKVGDQDVPLPPGFRERTEGRGLVAMGMVPQTRVLAHASVGAFLTHSAPGSVIEGMQHGHPLVLLPFFGDQRTVARFMEGKKVGLPVPRHGGEDGSGFNRDGVASTVRAVFVEEEGRRVFAANAKKLQQVVADTARHERYIDQFLELLTFYKGKSPKQTLNL